MSHQNQGQQNFGAGGDFMMNYGLQYGKRFIDDGEKTVSRYIDFTDMKVYFRVNNQYVKSKLGLLIFPFTKTFLRKRCDFGDEAGSKTAEYYPPIDDVFAPDLYIPLMAVITYTILSAFAQGMQHGSVAPDVLAGTLTWVLGLIAFEVISIKVARYVVGLSSPVAIMDLVALSGYKFTGICYVVFCRLFAPLDSWIFSFVALVVAASMAFFLYKSLSDLFSKGERIQKRALPIVYAVTALQFPWYLWFSSRPF